MYRMVHLTLPCPSHKKKTLPKTKTFTVDTDVDFNANSDADADAKVTTKTLPVLSYKQVNPSALRKAKIVYNFGLSECNRLNKNCLAL